MKEAIEDLLTRKPARPIPEEAIDRALEKSHQFTSEDRRRVTDSMDDLSNEELAELGDDAERVLLLEAVNSLGERTDQLEKTVTGTLYLLACIVGLFIGYQFFF